MRIFRSFRKTNCLVAMLPLMLWGGGSARGAESLIGKGTFTPTSRGTFAAAVQSGSNYQAKVVAIDTKGKYQLNVLDSSDKSLGSQSGSGTVYVRFLNSSGTKVTIEVLSQGATGGYRVYLRPMSTVGSSGSSVNITGKYNVSFQGNPNLSGTASITQSGSQVSVSGNVKNKGAGLSSWTATGSISGNNVTLNYTKGVGAHPTRGDMKLTVDANSYVLSGTVTINGKQQSVKFTPVSTQAGSSTDNLSGMYSSDWGHKSLLNGPVKITQKGTGVSLQGNNSTTRRRWKWSGNGTFDGQNLRFDFSDEHGGSGSATLIQQRPGVLSGSYSRTEAGKTSNGKLTLKAT